MHVLNKLPVSGPFYVCLIPKPNLLIPNIYAPSKIFPFFHHILRPNVFLLCNFYCLSLLHSPFQTKYFYAIFFPIFVVAPSLSLFKQFVSPSRIINIGRPFKFVFKIGHTGSTYRRRYLKRCGDQCIRAQPHPQTTQSHKDKGVGWSDLPLYNEDAPRQLLSSLAA